MTTTETGIIADKDHRVLVTGKGELVESIAEFFKERGASVALTGTVPGCVTVDEQDETALVADAAGKLGGLTVVVNVCLPLPSDGVASVMNYPEHLRKLCEASAEAMESTTGSPAIINVCALPAMYTGTELEDYMGTLRGGITGITRTFARKYGKRGLRVTAVQTGLVELSDLSWLSDQVREVEVPVKSWVSLDEIASFTRFLAVESTYTTGQMMIIDGGLTAGISGV